MQQLSFLVAGINIWQFLSWLSVHSDVHMQLCSPSTGQLNAQKKKKWTYSLVYAGKYQNSHGENINFKEITKDLTFKGDIMQVYKRLVRLLLLLFLFLWIFSLLNQNFLTTALRGAHLQECANTKRTP